MEREKQFQLELEVDFEYLTKKEMAEEQNMSQQLCSNIAYFGENPSIAKAEGRDR